MATPYERLRALREIKLGPRVQIQLLHEHMDCHGVVRLWQISCMLPALSQEASGLHQTGLNSMAIRLRRMLALSLCGDITSVESSEGRLDTGQSYLVMTVTQFEPASDPQQAQ